MKLGVALAVAAGVIILLNQVHLLGIAPLSGSTKAGIGGAVTALALSIFDSKRLTRRR